jgi:hypothetical protein
MNMPAECEISDHVAGNSMSDFGRPLPRYLFYLDCLSPIISVSCSALQEASERKLLMLGMRAA